MTLATSLFDNPLAGWANDDLLLSEATRDRVAAVAANALPIFYWPELCAAFVRHDAVANKARRASRVGGTRAALIGYAGLIVAAVTPLLTVDPDDGVAVWLGVAAAVLAIAATIWGYAQMLTGRRKREWLFARFLTERLRQMNFQFVLANLDLAVAVMRDPARLSEWEARRTAALAAFELHIAGPIVSTYQTMRDDLAEEAFWIVPAWRKRPTLPPPSPETDLLFEVLANQRFGIQQRFATLKTIAGAHSSVSRAATVRTVSDVLTLFVLIGTAIGGVLLAFEMPSDSWAIESAVAIVAVSTATVALLRVLNEGLQLGSEAERYRWYQAAVAALARRFERAGAAGKVELLRDMERLSYQEMRWFLNAFSDSRFVI